jgi:hypothetical protein
MIRTAAKAVALALGLLAVCAAAAPLRDGAVIVGSGSTNTAGFHIDVWSDGTGVFAVMGRGGSEQSTPKSFNFSASVASRFFEDLKAARAGNATGVPCMKSASFGTTTRVEWHDWTSPDLDCPAENALTAALVRDVNAIRAAAGADAVPVHRGIPIAPPASPEP